MVGLMARVFPDNPVLHITVPLQPLAVRVCACPTLGFSVEADNVGGDTIVTVIVTALEAPDAWPLTVQIAV